MAKKPNYDQAVTPTKKQEYVTGKGGHIEPASEYKRVSYDIFIDQHKALGQAALDTDCKRNALVRAMISLFMEDQETYDRVVERAKQ